MSGDENKRVVALTHKAIQRYQQYHDDEDEDDDDLVLAPIRDEQMFKCTRCNTLNTGYEQKEASFITFIAAFLALITFKFFAMVLMPLILESTKTVIHKCNKCDNLLAKQELLSLPSLTDKILSFKCGGCAVVISRKYAIVLIILMSILYFMIPARTVKPGLTLDVKWETYANDCGKNAILNNGFRAKKVFDQKYNGNIVQWKGAVTSVAERESARKTDRELNALVYIKMIPTEAREEFPDVELWVYNSASSEIRAAANGVKPGTMVSFKGTCTGIGNEFTQHSLDLIDFQVLEHEAPVNLTDIKSLEYVSNTASSLRAPPKSAEVPASPVAK